MRAADGAGGASPAWYLGHSVLSRAKVAPHSTAALSREGWSLFGCGVGSSTRSSEEWEGEGRERMEQSSGH